MSTERSNTDIAVQPASRLRRSDAIVAREIVGETLLVPITGQLANLQEVFSLNDTGAFLWQQLDGDLALADIAVSLSDEFEVDVDTASADVALLAQELLDLGMIELADE